MPQAVIITLESELPEAMAVYLKAGNGKALARESDRLETASRRRGLASMLSLLSESQAALIAEMKEQGFDTSKMRVPPELWYSPADGLKTVRGLIEHVTANLNDFKQPNPILRDLKAAEQLLIAADAAKVRFHFTRVHL